MTIINTTMKKILNTTMTTTTIPTALPTWEEMQARRTRRTPRKARPLARPWPPPESDLPPLHVLEALSHGDERPYHDWQASMNND